MPNPVPDHEIVVAATDALRAGFVELVRDLARDAIAERGRFALAVPGGSVASVLLTGLGAHDVAWRSTDLFWCDERFVPQTHADSNFGAAQAGWLQPLEGAGMRRHPMVDGDEDAERAAARYSATLVSTLGTPPVLDLVVLGVGEDGHVGSIFPGHPTMDERERWVVAIDDAPKRPRQRVSLTLPVFTSARCLVVAAFGITKCDVMRCAVEEFTCLLPVARTLRGASRAVVLLDDGAACGLSVFRRASGT
ncbi:MAG: 6-phosphogluconolactonase [Gemmatimonadaceae bacterium]|nr:6-phosphogluconolactonase [Gemmatimonadaceae bacterium]